ncbi:MAG: tRNA (adenosine(37)-N6)-threonylcarbamoyltransferase complex dimerization subunit type 1 TsaB [Bacilli bacterium]|nr:tRNA (adenosine(37)-N6)-threonylcarbamoyltransferase complex dimerization subunit type 1 TsaB [Bacilli bacterium]MDD3422822.1 tRNA (adenosine(37)-N6)-threonylcarbamoyltransferase complex dimerization subunit type 1 TsaB [Bacilli bacterium]MDD4066241.1 tRNA (adenosine(37)-N6)-threonylcarbamoyltransferase complex dimerization subunit type 1 TsaB [Bacilli bacterium]
MGRYLLIDTSNRFLSVGIVIDNKLVYKLQYEAWQRQSEFAVLEIQKALKKVGITPKELTGVVVSKGPGSYTGIRIALTIGKVLAYSLHLPIMAFSSLQVLAGMQEHCLVLMDARSNRAYVGEYNQGQAINPDCIMALEEIQSKRGKLPLIGDKHLLGEEDQDIDIIQNMFELLSVGKWEEDVNLVQPQYLK